MELGVFWAWTQDFVQAEHSTADNVGSMAPCPVFRLTVAQNLKSQHRKTKTKKSENEKEIRIWKLQVSFLDLQHGSHQGCESSLSVHSSGSSRPETVQQSCRLLVHRGDCLYLVSIAYHRGSPPPPLIWLWQNMSVRDVYHSGSTKSVLRNHHCLFHLWPRRFANSSSLHPPRPVVPSILPSVFANLAILGAS